MLEIQPTRKTDRYLKISPVANMRLAHGNHTHLADARVVPVAHKRVVNSTLRHHDSQPHTTTPQGRCPSITSPWYLSHSWTSLELKLKIAIPKAPKPKGQGCLLESSAYAHSDGLRACFRGAAGWWSSLITGISYLVWAFLYYISVESRYKNKYAKYPGIQIKP